MDYQKLRVEIALPVYAGKTDTQIADILSVKVPVNLGYRALEAVEVLDAIGQTKVAQIQDASVETTAKGHVAAAAWDAYLSTTGQLRVATGTGGRAVLDQLVIDRLLEAADVASLEAKAQNIAQMSRAEVLGIGTVTPGDVERARGGRW